MGESVTGYSRVPRKVYPTMPNNMRSTDITPANTGRDILVCEIALMVILIKMNFRNRMKMPARIKQLSCGLEKLADEI